MSWYVRLTRYASVHMVYAQENSNSCGMACMMMVNFKIKKAAMLGGFAAAAAVSSVPIIGSMVGATMANAALDYAVKSEPYVYQQYVAVTGSPYDGTADSDMDQFPAVLARLGCGNWETTDAAGGEAGIGDCVRTAVAGGAPCIIAVRWPAGNSHFMVVDETHGNNLCINDPWDGQVRITGAPTGTSVTYNAGSTPIGFSLGGTRHTYARGDTGTLRAWITRRL